MTPSAGAAVLPAGGRAGAAAAGGGTPSDRGDLLGLEGLDGAAITALLDEAERCARFWQAARTRSAASVPSAAGAEHPQAPAEVAPWARGRTVALLFAENSTRTRVSFEQAARLVGAYPIHLGNNGSSMAKGEDLRDTAATLAAAGADAIVLRHGHAGAAERLAAQIDVPVINAGDGTHEHPTQGLLDLFTLRQACGRVNGLRVAIVGDALHSRVARSTAWGLAALGASTVLVGPPALVPPELAEALPVEVVHDLRTALAGADVVMALRLQKERMTAAYLPSEAEYHARWGITEERMAWAKPGARFMHPGPSNRGVEVSDAVHDHERSLVRGQVRNGVAVRMAVLARALRTAGEAA